MNAEKKLSFAAAAIFLATLVPAVNALPSSENDWTGPRTSNARQLGPVTWGFPDKPYCRRRGITDQDRALVKSFRSGKRTPLYTTEFTSRKELDDNWDAHEDDNRDGDFLSCRRAQNVDISDSGLRLRTKIATNCSAKWSTGYILSKKTYGYGYYEATMKIADCYGMDNSFWLTTDDHYEIDVAEVHFPNYIHFACQYWPVDKTEKHSGVGWGANFTTNFARGFHDFGLLYTKDSLVYVVDGVPVAAATLNNAASGKATLRLSSALLKSVGRVPAYPEGHDMFVRSLRIYQL
ncbi:MAG TPA: glycoside hydrolase family 16 protein [Oculatellaceae cyanobacterium]